jgi:hypothetical protein
MKILFGIIIGMIITMIFISNTIHDMVNHQKVLLCYNAGYYNTCIFIKRPKTFEQIK